MASINQLTARKKAFTLAEVLITLGVIGVVAAMTIPTIMRNIQITELKTAFKKSYTTLNQALNQIIADNGSEYKCYLNPIGTNTSSECTSFWPDFKTKLKVQKVYYGVVDGVNAPNYTGTDLITAQGGYKKNAGCNGGDVSLKVSKTVWTLADGSMLISYSDTFGVGSFFILDTNGIKKPNKWGYDLFILEFRKKSLDTSTISVNDSTCQSYEKDGYTIESFLSR